MAGKTSLGELGQGVAFRNQGDGSAALGNIADKKGGVGVEGVVGEARDDVLGVVVRDGAWAGNEGSLRVGGEVEIRIREG